MSGPGVIANEPPQVCEMCNVIDECRPYGPNGEQICFNCATTKCDPAQVEKKMGQYLFGENK